MGVSDVMGKVQQSYSLSDFCKETFGENVKDWYLPLMDAMGVLIDRSPLPSKVEGQEYQRGRLEIARESFDTVLINLSQDQDRNPGTRADKLRKLIEDELYRVLSCYIARIGLAEEFKAGILENGEGHTHKGLRQRWASVYRDAGAADSDKEIPIPAAGDG